MKINEKGPKTALWKELWLPLLALFLSSMFFRTILLDLVPIGLSDDELLYVLSAKSFWYTGRDLTETWSPVSFQPPPKTIKLSSAKVPYILFSPLIGSNTLSLFTSRIGYACISSLLVVSLYLISKKLLGTSIAWVVGLVALINPWSIMYGRTAYEAPVAVAITLGLFLSLLYTRSWMRLTSVILFIGALLSYMGMSTILVFFGLVFIWFSWFIQKKKYTSQNILLSILYLTIFVIYLFTIKTQSGGERVSDLLTPNHPIISAAVQRERQSMISMPLVSVWINRYSIFLRMFLDKYLNAWSPTYLFLSGDANSHYAVRFHGLFYLIDIFALIIGTGFLWKKHRTIFWGFILLCLLAPLPAAMIVGESTYVFRAGLGYPILMILIGVGWHTCIRMFHHKKIIKIILVIVYLPLLANFLITLLLRNPIINPEAYSFSARIVARYVYFAQKKHIPVHVIEEGPVNLFRQYLFYTNSYNEKTHSQLAKVLTRQEYKLPFLSFTNCDTDIQRGETVIASSNKSCVQNLLPTRIAIPSLSDNGSVYRIYNDSICAKYDLKSYQSHFTLRQFALEKLNEAEFCKTYIVKEN